VAQAPQVGAVDELVVAVERALYGGGAIQHVGRKAAPFIGF
jgi:hypothetical protein